MSQDIRIHLEEARWSQKVSISEENAAVQKMGIASSHSRVITLSRLQHLGICGTMASERTTSLLQVGVENYKKMLLTTSLAQRSTKRLHWSQRLYQHHEKKVQWTATDSSVEVSLNHITCPPANCSVTIHCLCF